MTSRSYFDKMNSTLGSVVMDKENQDLREKLAGESSLLKGNIDQNQNQATKRINELAEKLAGMIKGGDMAIKDLTAR